MKVKKVRRTSTHQPHQSIPSITDEVVGFLDKTTSIVKRLTGGLTKLRIVAIWGMGGLGKTSLASKVYNCSSVMYRFHVRARCSVSQVLDKHIVLIQILEEIDSGNYSDMREQDLSEKLRQQLKGKRYLIFLDDVWTIQVWNSLSESFPDDPNGSRIILTSRLHNVAPQSMLDEEPYLLRSLTNDESLELLQRKLFPGKAWPSELHGVAMAIIEICKGLPLTIIIVAGLVARMEHKDWNLILDGFSSGVVSSSEQCMKTLELSYKHLPHYLRPCFLYFGAFPEDEQVSVRKMIQLWITEGFVRKTKLKRAEDVAEDYMVDLMERSLVMVAQKRSIGGAKTCRIHDLLRDFCLTKAKQENFFHLLQGENQLSDFNEPRYLQRLSIYSNPVQFQVSNFYCPRTRSLLFLSPRKKGLFELHWIDISFVIHIFKILKVLDLEQIHLGSEVSSEIGLLRLLKYLAIQGRMSRIPSSSSKLSNLQKFFGNSRN